MLSVPWLPVPTQSDSTSCRRRFRCRSGIPTERSGGDGSFRGASADCGGEVQRSKCRAVLSFDPMPRWTTSFDSGDLSVSSIADALDALPVHLVGLRFVDERGVCPSVRNTYSSRGGSFGHSSGRRHDVHRAAKYRWRGRRGDGSRSHDGAHRYGARASCQISRFRMR